MTTPPAPGSTGASAPSDGPGTPPGASAHPNPNGPGGVRGGHGRTNGGGHGPTPVGPAPLRPVAGRATVPSASGRATVGGPRVPAGRVGAGGSGRPGTGGAPRTAVLPSGRGSDGDQPDVQSGGKGTGRKSRLGRWRWRSIVLASAAVVVMLAGGGLIGVAYLYDSVPEPADFSPNENTFVYSADGAQIAKLGGENREIVSMSRLSDEVKVALIAGEDKNFFNHHGIDLWGVARAAWNNITGGETQGASTITQQYARNAAKDLEVTYARKLREAVMARRLEEEHSKDEILGFYVNTVWFGRGSSGVGAAAKAYFGKAADQLTVEQAAVLGAVLKQPEPNEYDGTKGFDPHLNPDAARIRWNYVLDNMVEMGKLDRQKRAAMVYPDKTLRKYSAKSGETGVQGTGTGFVITKYVEREMAAWGITDWRNKGYRITTTINSKAQKALEAQLFRTFEWKETCHGKGDEKECTNDVVKAVDHKVDGVYTKIKGYPKNVIAAGVAIDPRNGRVLAYYGGADGTGIDYAGKINEGTIWEDGGHPPASSFKVYTLAAAIDAGISLKSTWDPTPIVATGKKKNCDKYKLCPYEVENAGRDAGSLKCKRKCTLQDVTRLSLNVPFFKIAKKIEPKNVVAMAHAAGINTMWAVSDGKARDLTKPETDTSRASFDYQVGFGQYPITVLDHATGMATFANHGIYNKPHVVIKVEKKDERTGKYQLVPNTGEVSKAERRIRQEVADEVTGMLKQLPKSYYRALAGGRQAAAKTGTWESKVQDKAHSNVWTVGYTPQIAAAIWVGNVKNASDPIYRPKALGGGNITSVGLPAEIWQGFMNQAHADMKLPLEPLANGTNGKLGEVEGVGDGVEPSKKPKPKDCTPMPICLLASPNVPGNAAVVPSPSVGEPGPGPGHGPGHTPPGPEPSATD
ncbi:transglycosylase domain-containing protein [Catellatospora chokoriensis]|uniref:Penicillin-binding protein 1A n=1 Tax=Catellatospora chokoriensis TaxID=310353 RepID=A0A8J3NUJ9_9ACTN|nr:transglycosylase domain-containing protein [Catellatospora chokoriensis]GIF92938.1 penicillin-binding protein 1A [Catellatospora chokoriensis]